MAFPSEKDNWHGGCLFQYWISYLWERINKGEKIGYFWSWTLRSCSDPASQARELAWIVGPGVTISRLLVYLICVCISFICLKHILVENLKHWYNWWKVVKAQRSKLILKLKIGLFSWMKISDVDLSNNENTSGESCSWLTLNPEQRQIKVAG